MKVLKAKIKHTSVHYKNGLNQKGKSIWLTITGFSPRGNHNYKVRAIKGIKNGYAEYEEVWVGPDEIFLKQQEDDQLSLDIFSPQEQLENLHNPRYFNQRRYQITTKNETLFFHAPDEETLKNVVKQYGLSEYTVKQVKRLSKKELNE